MKKFGFVFLWLLILVSFAVCADAGGNTINAEAAKPELLYPNLNYFLGMNIGITGDDKIYSTNDPAIEPLLMSTSKGKEYLEHYYFKNTFGVIMSLSSIADIIAQFNYMGTHVNSPRTK